MQLEPNDASLDLLHQGTWQACITLSQQTDIHGKGLHSLEHAVDMPWSRGTGGGKGTRCRTGSSAEHGGHATHECLFDLLWADEMNVRVDAARSHDHALAGDHLGPGPHHNVDPRLDVWITSLANLEKQSILDANVGLDDAPVVDNQGVGHDGIDTIRSQPLALSHAIANDLASTKLDLFTIDREILFHMHPEIGIREADAISCGGAKHVDIRTPGYLIHRVTP